MNFKQQETEFPVENVTKAKTGLRTAEHIETEVKSVTLIFKEIECVCFHLYLLILNYI